MTDLDPFVPNHSIHFTGICGVGMTALALCLQDKGLHITGSDTGEQFVTSSVLEARGIRVDTGFTQIKPDNNINALVYTGSHGGSTNPQVISAQALGIPTYSLAQALGLLSQAKKTIAVCGVGGKTTTSAMLATIFEQAQKNPSYAIGVGGVSTLAFPGKWDPKGEHFIAEADEYATSPGTDVTPRFMSLSPHAIICTGIAHDHPDVYANLEAVQQAFEQFFHLLPRDGVLVACGDNQALMSITKHVIGPKIVTYGLEDDNQWQIIESKSSNQTQEVVIKNPQGDLRTLLLRVPGIHNALNALAALIVAETKGIAPEMSAQALSTFAGTKRRFEIVGTQAGVTFVDDYAHHPNEVRATLVAAKEWFESRRLIVVFQPHTFSRTKTLLDAFAHSFAQADSVLITDIFASAREEFDPTITAEMLAEAIHNTSNNAQYVPQNDLVSTLNELVKPGDVVITMGAGDIYKIHEQFGRD
jgi:UDP-N-acetylmuramate--alanine ligase